MADSVKKQVNRILKRYYNQQATDSYIAPSESIAYQSNVPTESLDLSPNSRNDFLEQKRLQSTYSSQQNARWETFENGTLSALADCFRASKKQKVRILKLESEHELDCETMEAYSSALVKSNKKIADLKEQLSKSKKQCKKLSHKVDDMEKILILLSKHLDVCDKREPLSDLVADWRYFSKKHKYQ